MTSIGVGERNTRFVLVVYARKVCFQRASGKVMVKRLATTNLEAIAARERAAAQKAESASTGGGPIDLF